MGSFLGIFNYYGDPLLEIYVRMLFSPPLLLWIFVSEYLVASLLINTETKGENNHKLIYTILFINTIALVIGFVLSKLVAYQPTFEDAIQGKTLFDEDERLSQWRRILGYLTNYLLFVLSEGLLLRIIYGLRRGMFTVSPYIVSLLCNTVSFLGFLLLFWPLAYLWNLLL